MNGSELYLNFPYFIVRHHSNSFQIELKSTYANLHFFIYTCSMFFLIKTQKMTDKNETRNETLKNSTICRNSNKPVKFKFFIPIDKYLIGYTRDVYLYHFIDTWFSTKISHYAIT